MIKLLLIIFISVFTLCYAVRQQIGFSSERRCTGDAILLESKQPDMTSFEPDFVLNSKSHSAIGYWGTYKGINYNYSDTLNSLTGGLEVRSCNDNNVYNLTISTRYLGPPDTSTHSISFYEGTTYRGRELTITGPASSNIPFVPRSLFSTGNTSWTFYSGSDFDGPATCFIPTQHNWCDMVRDLNSTMSNVKSILRGCNRHIDYYIYGSSEPEDILLAQQ